jgi:hypothetical protein
MQWWRLVSALTLVSILVVACVLVSVLSDVAATQKLLLARSEEQLQAVRDMADQSTIKPFLTVRRKPG